MLQPLALFLMLTVLAGLPLPVLAQSIWAQGGTSTLMSASGFQLDYKWAPVQGWFGAGVSDGAVIGGYLGSHYHNYDIGLGDRYQPMNLETDIFDGNRYFAGRGVYLSRRGERQSWTAFAGATAGERSYNFFHAFDTEQSTAAFFYSRQFAKLAVSSFTIAQNKATSIHSLQYSVTPDFKLSIGGGIGYNSPYFSSGAQYTSRKFLAAASYSAMGHSFQRIGGVPANAPEHVGSNVRFRYQPLRRLGFSLSHENLFSPVLKNGEEQRTVSMDAASVFTAIKGFNLSASASNSKSGSIESRTQDFTAARDITKGIAVSGSLMRMTLNSETTNIYIGNLREKISPRLSLNQGISRQGTTNNLTFGGRFLSNRVILGLQHDMVYSTLAGGFGGRSSMHIWTVNLNVPLFHGISIHTDSMVDPTGKVRYTAWADGIGMGRNAEDAGARPTQAIPSFSRFVVKGVVQDTQGKPVWGISVHVDGQNAYSDSAGRFFLRFRRGEQYPVAIIPEQSLNSQMYRIVRAPVSVLTETEELAPTIIIVVERDTRPVPQKHKRSEIQLPDAPVKGAL